MPNGVRTEAQAFREIVFSLLTQKVDAGMQRRARHQCQTIPSLIAIGQARSTRRSFGPITKGRRDDHAVGGHTLGVGEDVNDLEAKGRREREFS
jgi:hypothetical protein